jgi:hypothetical protein
MLATSEATQSPTVAQRSTAAREQQCKEVFKRGNIGREATEVLLMEALHNAGQRLWRSTFDVFSNTHSCHRCSGSKRLWGRILSLCIALVAAV